MIAIESFQDDQNNKETCSYKVFTLDYLPT